MSRTLLARPSTPTRSRSPMTDLLGLRLQLLLPSQTFSRAHRVQSTGHHAETRRPIFPASSATHSAPFGPATMPCGSDPGGGYGVLRNVARHGDPPDVVASPLRGPQCPVGPRDDRVRTCARGARGYSTIRPAVVMRPIRSAIISTNQTAPSGPAAIPNGPAFGVGRGYSKVEPSVEIRPMLLPRCSVNHSAPPAPAAIIAGPASAVGRGYAETSPSGMILPIRPPCIDRRSCSILSTVMQRLTMLAGSLPPNAPT